MLNFFFVLFGTWVGTFVLLLDSNKPWQVCNLKVQFMAVALPHAQIKIIVLK